MIIITSDLHMFHDRDFIYRPRGFNSCREMTDCYMKELTKIKKDDELYILGDFCLGSDYEKITEVIRSIKGKIHLIIGNHDTDKKIEFYRTQGIDAKYADMLEYNSRRLYLSHYPTEVASKEGNYKTCIINCHGHTHSKEKFQDDKPYLYNVSVDANDNRFLTPDDILEDFRWKVKELRYLSEG